MARCCLQNESMSSRSVILFSSTSKHSWSTNCQCCWKRLKIKISGPVHGISHATKTLSATISIIWWRHARWSTSVPIMASIRVQAPDLQPVLLLVVSKHNAFMRSLIFQSSRHSITAFAITSPVPEQSFEKVDQIDSYTRHSTDSFSRFQTIVQCPYTAYSDQTRRNTQYCYFVKISFYCNLIMDIICNCFNSYRLFI